VGIVAVSLKKYFEWLTALRRCVLYAKLSFSNHLTNSLTRYIALAAWGVTIWVSFQPLVLQRYQGQDENGADRFQSSHNALLLISRIMFAVMLCCVILLGEKFTIQIMLVIHSSSDILYTYFNFLAVPTNSIK
jgi:hypothetical protein